MECVERRELPDRFQFLIGRLDTWIQYEEGLYPAAFQFLIGRLDTNMKQRVIIVTTWFQFLIGRLDTKCCSKSIPFSITVSIPHR